MLNTNDNNDNSNDDNTNNDNYILTQGLVGARERQEGLQHDADCCFNVEIDNERAYKILRTFISALNNTSY